MRQIAQGQDASRLVSNGFFPYLYVLTRKSLRHRLRLEIQQREASNAVSTLKANADVRGKLVTEIELLERSDAKAYLPFTYMCNISETLRCGSKCETKRRQQWMPQLASFELPSTGCF